MFRREKRKEKHVLHNLCLERECFIFPVEKLYFTSGLSVVTDPATEPAIFWARLDPGAVRQLDTT